MQLFSDKSSSSVAASGGGTSVPQSLSAARHAVSATGTATGHHLHHRQIYQDCPYSLLLLQQAPKTCNRCCSYVSELYPKSGVGTGSAPIVGCLTTLQSTTAENERNERYSVGGGVGIGGGSGTAAAVVCPTCSDPVETEQLLVAATSLNGSDDCPECLALKAELQNML